MTRRSASSSAGKCEGASRILLREVVELLSAKVSAQRDVVVAVIPQDRGGNAVCLIAIEGALSIREARDSTRKDERWRSPVGRVLVVARDARLA